MLFVKIIVSNMVQRGLIWTTTDAIIATTECVVLTNNIRQLTDSRKCN